jgi:hypothetical protein
MKSLLALTGIIVLTTISNAQSACCAKPKSAEAEFMALAQEMMEKAEGKSDCCARKSASCGEKPEAKKYKVFVASEGYKFFGCSMMAMNGRSQLLAKGMKVGPVQPVTR